MKFMLWYDNNPKTPVKDKIQNAIDYYQKKYLQKPNYVAVPKNLFPVLEPFPVEIFSNQYVLSNHFWIGVK